MKVILSLLIIMLAIGGIADASYLTYEKFAGVIPTCGESFDCGTVLSSKYASIGPIPMSFLGLLYYVAVLKLALLHYLESDILLRKTKKFLPVSNQLKTALVPQKLLLLLTSLGFGFSMILVGVMAFVIEAWCLFCLVSAGISTLMFLTAGLLNYFYPAE
jgi:uncharacterized membrane protein